MKISEKNYDDEDFKYFLKELLNNETYASGEDSGDFSDMSPAELHEYLQKTYDWSDDDLSDAFSGIYKNKKLIADNGDSIDRLAINEGKDVWDIMNQLPKRLWGEVIEHFNDGIGSDIPNMSAAGRLQYCVDCVRNNHPEIDDTSDSVTMDVNGDGDTDVAIADTDGNGKPDTAIVDADTKAEEKEATKTIKEKLGLDGKDKTSTGKTKDELGSKTLSDERQKNILSALIDNRF